jgi:hypothetical protein
LSGVGEAGSRSRCGDPRPAAGGEESFHRLKDEGVEVNDHDVERFDLEYLDISRKIIAASPIPPPVARNRSIGWRTMAVVSTMSAPVYALQTLTELRYDVWREFDPDDTLRFYALRMGEASLIKLSPQQIIANGTDWRFLNELKRELKT